MKAKPEMKRQGIALVFYQLSVALGEFLYGKGPNDMGLYEGKELFVCAQVDEKEESIYHKIRSEDTHQYHSNKFFIVLGGDNGFVDYEDHETYKDKELAIMVRNPKNPNEPVYPEENENYSGKDFVIVEFKKLNLTYLSKSQKHRGSALILAIKAVFEEFYPYLKNAGNATDLPDYFKTFETMFEVTLSLLRPIKSWDSIQKKITKEFFKKIRTDTFEDHKNTFIKWFYKGFSIQDDTDRTLANLALELTEKLSHLKLSGLPTLELGNFFTDLKGWFVKKAINRLTPLNVDQINLLIKFFQNPKVFGPIFEEIKRTIRYRIEVYEAKKIKGGLDKLTGPSTKTLTQANAQLNRLTEAMLAFTQKAAKEDYPKKNPLEKMNSMLTLGFLYENLYVYLKRAEDDDKNSSIKKELSKMRGDLKDIIAKHLEAHQKSKGNILTLKTYRTFSLTLHTKLKRAIDNAKLPDQINKDLSKIISGLLVNADEKRTPSLLERCTLRTDFIAYNTKVLEKTANEELSSRKKRVVTATRELSTLSTLREKKDSSSSEAKTLTRLQAREQHLKSEQRALTRYYDRTLSELIEDTAGFDDINLGEYSTALTTQHTQAKDAVGALNTAFKKIDTLSSTVKKLCGSGETDSSDAKSDEKNKTKERGASDETLESNIKALEQASDTLDTLLKDVETKTFGGKLFHHLVLTFRENHMTLKKDISESLTKDKGALERALKKTNEQASKLQAAAQEKTAALRKEKEALTKTKTLITTLAKQVELPVPWAETSKKEETKENTPTPNTGYDDKKETTITDAYDALLKKARNLASINKRASALEAAQKILNDDDDKDHAPYKNLAKQFGTFESFVALLYGKEKFSNTSPKPEHHSKAGGDNWVDWWVNVMDRETNHKNNPIFYRQGNGKTSRLILRTHLDGILKQVKTAAAKLEKIIPNAFKTNEDVKTNEIERIKASLPSKFASLKALQTSVRKLTAEDESLRQKHEKCLKKKTLLASQLEEIEQREVADKKSLAVQLEKKKETLLSDITATTNNTIEVLNGFDGTILEAIKKKDQMNKLKNILLNLGTLNNDDQKLTLEKQNEKLQAHLGSLNTTITFVKSIQELHDAEKEKREKEKQEQQNEILKQQREEALKKALEGASKEPKAYAALRKTLEILSTADALLADNRWWIVLGASILAAEIVLYFMLLTLTAVIPATALAPIVIKGLSFFATILNATGPLATLVNVVGNALAAFAATFIVGTLTIAVLSIVRFVVKHIVANMILKPLLSLVLWGGSKFKKLIKIAFKYDRVSTPSNTATNHGLHTLSRTQVTSGSGSTHIHNDGNRNSFSTLLQKSNSPTQNNNVGDGETNVKTTTTTNNTSASLPDPIN